MAQSTAHDTAALKQRVANALAEGRTQSALDNAKQLCKAAPTDEHRALLRQATLERARDLQSKGMMPEAAVVWRNLLPFSDVPGIREAVAEGLARCGFAAEASVIAAQLPADAPGRQRLVGAFADAAVEKGAEGKALIPADLHPSFDALRAAFGFAEQGKDEEARQALQAIGLQSPFLEWKVLLRGLLAWYARDDARALENWTRLQPQRLPWRIAAPLRFRIDPEFRQSQSAAAQASLQKAADRLDSANDEESKLLRLRTSLHHAKLVRDVFAQAEQLGRSWRTTHPDWVDRLRRCLAAVILERGIPEDATRLANALGAPADDARFLRLLAVGMERRNTEHGSSSYMWSEFAKEVASSPAWEPHQALAQALIWEHVGELFVGAGLEPDDGGETTRGVVEGFDDCFRLAIALTPDRRKPYFLRFDALYGRPGKKLKAIAAAEDLLKRFPDDLPTLRRLGQMYAGSKRSAKARACYERVLALDPLDRSIRRHIGRAYMDEMLDSRKPKIRAIREDLDRAATLVPESLPAISARRYFAEKLWGDPQEAERAAQRLGESANGRLASLYALAAEADRFPAADERKRRLADLKSAAKGTSSDQELQRLVETMADEMHPTGPAKEIVAAGCACLKKATVDSWPEAAVERFVLRLAAVAPATAFRKTAKAAERRFPGNPFLLLAAYDNASKSQRFLYESEPRLWKLGELLPTLPRERQQELLEAIEERGIERARLSRPYNFFGRFFANVDLEDDFGDGDFDE